MADFKFTCPHCNQSLEAPQEALGQIINCPSCQGSIQLPDQQPQQSATPLPNYASSDSSPSPVPPPQTESRNIAPTSRRIALAVIIGIVIFCVLGSVAAFLFLAQHGRSRLVTQPEAFEDRPFLGIALGMSEADVAACLDGSNLPYTVDKDKYLDYLRKAAQEAGGHFDESRHTWTVQIKGNARLKGNNATEIAFRGGRVKSVTVYATTHDGMIPTGGEKDRADQIFQTLHNTLKKQYGEPSEAKIIKGTKLEWWYAGTTMLHLEQGYSWEDKCFNIEAALTAGETTTKDGKTVVDFSNY
jgi:hypothetical protein